MRTSRLGFWLRFAPLVRAMRGLATGRGAPAAGNPLGLVEGPHARRNHGDVHRERPPLGAPLDSDAVELGSQLSFPASDPPAWMASTTSVGPPARDAKSLG